MPSSRDRENLARLGPPRSTGAMRRSPPSLPACESRSSAPPELLAGKGHPGPGRISVLRALGAAPDWLANVREAVGTARRRPRAGRQSSQTSARASGVASRTSAGRSGGLADVCEAAREGSRTFARRSGASRRRPRGARELFAGLSPSPSLAWATRKSQLRASACPGTIILAGAALLRRRGDEPPARLIGDKAYDSDGLDERLCRERGIELIAPHRSNERGRPRLSRDGSPRLRRHPVEAYVR